MTTTFFFFTIIPKLKVWFESYLHNAMANSAVWLSAHQKQADYHHHGNGYGHHQQPNHGATVKCLQGIRLLWKEAILNSIDVSVQNEIFHCYCNSSQYNTIYYNNYFKGLENIFNINSYQFISCNLIGLDYLFQLSRGVNL